MNKKILGLSIIFSILFSFSALAASNSYTALETLISGINNSPKYTFEGKIEIRDNFAKLNGFEDDTDIEGELTITLPDDLVNDTRIKGIKGISNYQEKSFIVMNTDKANNSDEYTANQIIAYKTINEKSYVIVDENYEFDSMYKILDQIRKKITGRDGEIGQITDFGVAEVGNISKSFREDGIAPTWQEGAAYMNNQGAGIKKGINTVFSIALWFLWVGFLGYELFNGACILFPVFRDKVTGDGTSTPWYLSYNTRERLKNMEEEPMKKWFTNEITRIAAFFLISVGIFSGLIMWIISALLNLLP